MATLRATHLFVVPDRQAAEGLVAALSKYGFPEVQAWPHGSDRGFPGMGWEVHVVDEGPYSRDIAGRRQLAGAELGARALARQFGGFRVWGSRGRVGGVAEPKRSDPPLLLVIPGARPPHADVHAAAAPSAGDLWSGSGQEDERSPSLEFLSAVDWAALSHAYGPAQDLPALITRLVGARDEESWEEVSLELANRVIHQGSCYSATAPALNALLHLVTEGAFRAAWRCDIYTDTLFAVGRYQDTLLAGRDRAAAYGEQPIPAAWTLEVRNEVGELVSPLLHRWGIEPLVNRLLLGVLAATYPSHGAAVYEKIADTARENRGTQAEAYLQLADQVICGESDRALKMAMQIATWADGITYTVLDDQTIDPGLRALHTLSDAVFACARGSRRAS